jgi:hypothetical protein
MRGVAGPVCVSCRHLTRLDASGHSRFDKSMAAFGIPVFENVTRTPDESRACAFKRVKAFFITPLCGLMNS